MKNKSKLKALYISYDGATDFLGQSQIIPYLKSISAGDIEFVFLSFDKESALRRFDIEQMKSELALCRINWISIPYHKRPKILAKFYDFFRGMITCIRLQRDYKFDIVHGRSFIGAILALILKKFYGVRFLLDYRGLWPDERIDAGVWNKLSISYKVAKYLEKILLLNADEIVLLTQKAKKLISSFSYLINRGKSITVIPTCTDLSLFKPAGDKPLKDDRDCPTILYLGSLGTWYMLEEMVDFFSALRGDCSSAHFQFLTAESNRDTIEQVMTKRSIPESAYSIQQAAYRDIPKHISMADLSIFFIKPLYSKLSSCPTKLGESLACGLPVVINSGIGDCDRIVKENNVGIVMDDLNNGSYQKVIPQINRILREKSACSRRCRETATKNFSLEDAGRQYQGIYRRLQGKGDYD